MSQLMQCVCGNRWFLNLPETNHLSDSLECTECGGYWESNHEYYDTEGSHGECIQSVDFHMKEWNKFLSSKDCMRTLYGHYSNYVPLLKHSPVNLMKKYKVLKEMIEYGSDRSMPEFNMYLRKIKMLLGVNNLDELNSKGYKITKIIKVERVYKSKSSYASNPRYIRAEDRHNVFVRDNYQCKECGRNNKQTTLHIDHIIPVSKGGRGNFDNLQTLCFDCNMAKSTRIW